jgi:hypothetical protein
MDDHRATGIGILVDRRQRRAQRMDRQRFGCE